MKITLMDIMESLNGDNVEDAQAALHEWFVEQGKKVHKQIVQPVMENTEEDDDLDDSYDRELPRTGDKVVIDERSGTIGEVVDQDIHGGPATFKVHYDDGTTGVHSVDSIENGTSEYDEVDEGRVDELSRDTQMAYAKKARKYRDQSNDDEKIGRRIVGLDMVANKARKEKAALQYEGEVTESDDDDFDLYSLEGYPDLEVEQDGNPTSGPQVGFIGIVNGYFINLLFTEQYSDYSVKGVMAEIEASDELPDDDSTENVLPSSQMPDEIKIPLAQAISDHVEKSIAAEYEYDDEDEEFDDEDEVDESADDEEFSKEFDRNSNAEERAWRNDTRANTVESLIAELQESFAGLETVSDKLQNVEGAQVGEEGKVPVNTKSTLPSKKGDKRVGGEAVEIKSKDHKGHALEKAPKVKDAPVKHHVQNSKDDPKKVTAPKSALLNKMDGSVNTQSPISGKGSKGLKK